MRQVPRKRPPNSPQMVLSDLGPIEYAPGAQDRCRLVVCSEARDLDDARNLLSALGLIGAE